MFRKLSHSAHTSLPCMLCILCFSVSRLRYTWYDRPSHRHQIPLCTTTLVHTNAALPHLYLFVRTHIQTMFAAAKTALCTTKLSVHPRHTSTTHRVNEGMCLFSSPPPPRCFIFPSSNIATTWQTCFLSFLTNACAQLSLSPPHTFSTFYLCNLHT
jgi:hypothetical protein